MEAIVSMSLLAPDEPAPVVVERSNGTSPLLLTVDHGDRRIPRALDQLGLDPAALERHIAYDIGILAVSRQVSQALDAPLIAQTYSRLVIDCNRQPGVPDSIPEVSDHTTVPGNLAVASQARTARETELFHPYHRTIRAHIAERQAAGRPPIYVAMHSFTPHMNGFDRPWQIGLLTHDDRELAEPILSYLRRDPDLVVGDNEPYAVHPDNDFGLMEHGRGGGLKHVGFEIRQDLIADAAGQTEWAERMTGLLAMVSERFGQERS